MKKIIPCLDTRDGRLVKGVNFQAIQELGDPVDYARRYQVQGADELVVLDITKTAQGHELRSQMIQAIAAEIHIPLTIGGGIANLADIAAAFAAGADKVSIASAAFNRPELINESVAEFGSDRITVAIDMGYVADLGHYYIYQAGGSKPTHRLAMEWVEESARRGAGALLITSVNHDGVRSGFDIDFLKEAANRVATPIIASGGAGSIGDFVDLFQQTQVVAGLAASIFHRGIVSIPEIKLALQSEGIEVSGPNH